MSDFYGLPTQVLENKFLRLEYLTNAGPRIVRLSVAGSSINLLAEVPDIKWETPYGEYKVYGGHRLWCAPEMTPLTYIPDTSGLQIEKSANGVRLSNSTSIDGGVRKSIEIQLHSDRAAVTLLHQLTNENQRSIECAPWAITQLALGGIAIVPQPNEPPTPDNRQPNRQITLWPYTRWTDSRLHVQDDLILIEARAQSPEFKIGTVNRHGWIGYLIDGLLFRKKFEPATDQAYPDRDSNVEIYCHDRFIELETLGCLQTLQPGETATHIETWDVLTGLNVPTTLAGARALYLKEIA